MLIAISERFANINGIGVLRKSFNWMPFRTRRYFARQLWLCTEYSDTRFGNLYWLDFSEFRTLWRTARSWRMLFSATWFFYGFTVKKLFFAFPSWFLGISNKSKVWTWRSQSSVFIKGVVALLLKPIRHVKMSSIFKLQILFSPSLHFNFEHIRSIDNWPQTFLLKVWIFKPQSLCLLSLL